MLTSSFFFNLVIRTIIWIRPFSTSANSRTDLSLSLYFLLDFNREDMEKVNIKFHDNYTVTYQHKKILQFVPELSVDQNLKVVTPNIPLLVSLKFHLNYSMQSNDS